MVAHKFIGDNEERILLYKLRFNKKHIEIIILPAPLLFDLLAESRFFTRGGREHSSSPSFYSRT